MQVRHPMKLWVWDNEQVIVELTRQTSKPTIECLRSEWQIWGILSTRCLLPLWHQERLHRGGVN